MKYVTAEEIADSIREILGNATVQAHPGVSRTITAKIPGYLEFEGRSHSDGVTVTWVPGRVFGSVGLHRIERRADRAAIVAILRLAGETLSPAWKGAP